MGTTTLQVSLGSELMTRFASWRNKHKSDRKTESDDAFLKRMVVQQMNKELGYD